MLFFPTPGYRSGSCKPACPLRGAGCGQTPPQLRAGRQGWGGRGRSGAGAGLCAGGGGKARLALAPAPLSKTHGKIYDPAREGAEGLSPPGERAAAALTAALSAALRSAPRRAGSRGRSRHSGGGLAISLSAPRHSALSSLPRSLGSKGHRLRPVRFPAAAALEIRKQRALFVKCLTAEFIKA